MAVCSSQKEITVLVHGNDSTLKYMPMENGTKTTTNWQSDGKWFVDVPIMFSRRKSQLEIIGSTPYGKILYQESQTGLLLKEHWESVGGTVTSPLTGVCSAPNRLDVSGLSKNGLVLQRTLAHGNWLPANNVWIGLGGNFSLSPTAVSTVPGHIHLFCLKGYNSSLYHKWWNGSAWTPSVTAWGSSNLRCMSPPTVVVIDRIRVDIFIRTPLRLSHGTYQEGAWFENVKWVDIGQPEDIAWASRPAAVLTKSRTRRSLLSGE